MVRDYNEIMGGVDLADMLISFYRVDKQTRKRWYLKIITHCINNCNVNAWLLYRRFSEQLQVPKKSKLTYLQFIKDVAYGLLMAGKQPGRSPGRPKSGVCHQCLKLGRSLWFISRFQMYTMMDSITGLHLQKRETDVDCVQFSLFFIALNAICTFVFRKIRTVFMTFITDISWQPAFVKI